ncbi:UDP-N-acetylmuramoyl-tripeptide--D-alanyl-D-alanine ligase [Clostridium cellulovorans]|uniref:UDP-N-acetylmuramoyl-tripeptide--D-alanyl-D-alanine ligase n=1 Tax=Clostridium cellulovorans (strain ATCC 35296 / DSM 3052 / OCM 3 / 743B) TaxID=573061 RepID=D9SKK0_CLOC7|nr:UDP-N-acetylmuramoyl-tripeptide--D-alanyl-D-alanine ligase [Clostridium cellulovorans]ADL51496.1 UDP-N-acetylmuramoylalanyl-D-glutamyl-2,6-diaminopimelate/D-alanyl-D-alanyl ligase [Clostridium cellulovorans 743B]
MENITLEEVLKATEGNLIINGPKTSFNLVSIDTRKLEKGCIYIAIKGENFDGNDFVVEAINKGAELCIIDKIAYTEAEVLNKSAIVLVENTKKALMQLAKYYRNKLDIKVIGVTGSTGKTSTKDLIAAALSEKLKVFKTKGNFNNEIGLPLMIFNLDNTYDVAVLEMGMSDLFEIQRLSDVARPDLGVITNIGISHIENLKTRENILKAKMEITTYFGKENLLIVNHDDQYLSTIDKAEYRLIKASISDDKNIDLKGESLVLKEDSCEFKLNESKFYIPMPGKHNISNALLAIACARELGVEDQLINKGFLNIEATSMRLDIEKNKGITIINDTYNASPDSMKAAIEVMKNLKGKRRIAVVGTMKELGENSFEYHKEMGIFAKENSVDILIAIGEFAKAYSEGFNNKNSSIELAEKEGAIAYLTSEIREEDIILVKASRSMKFETIVEALKIFTTNEGE